MITHIKDLELSELNVTLSGFFASTNIINLKCNICNNFIASNNKALANHKRGCKIKYQIKNETNIESDGRRPVDLVDDVWNEVKASDELSDTSNPENKIPNPPNNKKNKK
jgi:hypothetical protein